MSEVHCLLLPGCQCAALPLSVDPKNNEFIHLFVSCQGVPKFIGAGRNCFSQNANS